MYTALKIPSLKENIKTVPAKLITPVDLLSDW